MSLVLPYPHMVSTEILFIFLILDSKPNKDYKDRELDEHHGLVTKLSVFYY